MDKPEILAYSVATAAQVAEVSRPTIYRWMQLSGFPVARIGGCTRIPADAFKRWLEAQAGVRD
ncbi:helix-turn-helix domain-containing protein [Oscillibacter sp. MSJ-31]|uniref:helix-turn-helix domain-containing protein n=1 Tax=Oscillibacter sp. MSJ-31 TaxID=2841526 RepID=UPI001C1095AA|nr:helix-turn-helix domain-containing protein [Oscillibacter sp. MSJ-31]MBU5456514.1 helix-turn-helix domain-containing protein [Oscillibacter sp. MSJ-31]